jgi:predicted MFS family arabinose efflux permease
MSRPPADPTTAAPSAPPRPMRAAATRFVVMIGVLSFFADFAYEGSRSILGPYLALLGASATVVGVVTGGGELAGYALRLVSGRWADASKQFWPITILGYVIQMAAVPALALTGNWPLAAVLIVLERVGKAIRNPPRDVMLSHAGQQAGGIGWAFGLHEALDQLGAMVGPLVIAAVLALRHDYHLAFATLAIPAVVTVALLVLARLIYPRPQDFEAVAETPAPAKLPAAFWIYLAGAALVALGLADYPLIAFHFAKDHVVSRDLIPVLYAVAMASSGLGSLVFGHLFDRRGMGLLVLLTALSAVSVPLVFLTGQWGAVAGVALWGLCMGVHESIIPAAVAPMVSMSKRGTAYGLFTAGYGIAWFIGSAAIGLLYDHVSAGAVVAFGVAAEVAAIPLFVVAARMVRSRRSKR